MLDTLADIALIISLIGFVLFFIPTKFKNYFAVFAVIALEAGLLLKLPEFFAENNFFYPILIIAALPIVYITVKRLLNDDGTVKRFMYGVGIALTVYMPFALIAPLGNWLIGTVVYWIRIVFDAVGFEYKMADWNIFESAQVIPGYSSGYLDEIILGCTGITAIAILIGVVFLTKTNLIQRIGLLFLAIVPIYIINIFRNVFVIMSYFGQWFPDYPTGLGIDSLFTHPTIPGYTSFFWSHNVMCEIGAFIVIIVIALLLFKFTPGLVSSIREIINVYVCDLKLIFGKKPKA
ncbi:MAG: archaeosortase A [Methanocorpusculum sp.]|nr:archaeosortase A [Methanocorpusculum sp.]